MSDLTQIINTLFIKEIILIVCSLGIILASIRLWIQKDRKHMTYARLHLAGVIDISCIITLLILNQPLIALIYLVLCPIAAHAVANGNYYDELKEENQ